MTKLVQMLLENNGRVLPGTTPTKKLPAKHDIDKQALRQLKEAAQQIQFQQYGGFTRELVRDIRQATHQAAAQCASQALSQIPLLEEGCYSAVKKSIYTWVPGGDAQSKEKCQKLRLALFEFLPLTQQKLRLQAICQEYQSHLTQQIESQLQSDHPEAYAKYCTSQTITVSADVRQKKQTVKAEDMDYFVSREAQQLNLPKDSPLQKAIDKYEAVTALQRTLQSEKRVTAQIQDFRQTLTQKKGTLEQHRDTDTMRFLKAVATVLTLGVAALCGIWSVKGQEATEKMDRVLEENAASFGLCSGAR